ncbi:MAG: hypothetical protein AAF488_02155 [Planctomycetota bacterium]
MNLIQSSTIAALALLATGCLTISTPEDFLQLRSKNGLKLTTADDARLWVREHDLDAEGTLEFWTAALRNDLVERRGYLFVSEETSDDGTELIFDATVDGLDYRYAVTASLVNGWWGGKVRTVEYLAKREAFDEHLATVRKARSTIR